MSKNECTESEYGPQKLRQECILALQKVLTDEERTNEAHKATEQKMKLARKL